MRIASGRKGIQGVRAYLVGDLPSLDLFLRAPLAHSSSPAVPLSPLGFRSRASFELVRGGSRKSRRAPRRVAEGLTAV